jgi:hypothetical protein
MPAARTNTIAQPDAPRPVGHLEDRYWPANPTAPPGGQRGGSYQVFVPDPIAERELPLDGESISEIVEAR